MSALETEPRLTGPGEEHPVPVRIRMLIEDTFSKNVSLPSLCSQIGRSLDYVSRLFKDTYGATPAEYRTRCRMARARLLLAAGVLNVVEVSRQVGIDDPRYFARLFRETTGLSPREFRRENCRRRGERTSNAQTQADHR